MHSPADWTTAPNQNGARKCDTGPEMTVPGRFSEFNVVPVSRQKQNRLMAQRQLSGPTSKGGPRPGAVDNASITNARFILVGTFPRFIGGPLLALIVQEVASPPVLLGSMMSIHRIWTEVPPKQETRDIPHALQPLSTRNHPQRVIGYGAQKETCRPKYCEMFVSNSDLRQTWLNNAHPKNDVFTPRSLSKYN